MSEKLAVYAGTFDLLTVGHLWMIEQGSELFDQLVVAIGVNPDKRCMFTLEERLDMLRESTVQFPNIRVAEFGNLFLIHYAHSIGARFILRGVRDGGDYANERAMRHLNSDISPLITTVFLMPPREIAEVSSSMVKGLIGPKGWEEIVQRYVPPSVFRRLKEMRHAGTT